MGIVSLGYFFDFYGKLDRNIYFRKNVLVPHKLQPVIPYRALVLHAGLFDEALFGLSTEPLVYGALAPQIHSLLRPPFEFQIERPPIGRTMSPSDLVRQVVGLAIKNVVAGSARLFGFILRRVGRGATGKLLQVVAGAGIGISARELSDSIIVPRHDIGVPEFFKEVVWDVRDELLESLPAARSREEVSRRYKCLWDKDELDRMVSGSTLWKQMMPQLDEIERHYRYFPRRIFLSALFARWPNVGGPDSRSGWGYEFGTFWLLHQRVLDS